MTDEPNTINRFGHARKGDLVAVCNTSRIVYADYRVDTTQQWRLCEVLKASRDGLIKEIRPVAGGALMRSGDWSVIDKPRVLARDRLRDIEAVLAAYRSIDPEPMHLADIARALAPFSTDVECKACRKMRPAKDVVDGECVDCRH